MADVGNFSTITDEVKDVYVQADFEYHYRTAAPYRSMLRKDVKVSVDSEGICKFPLKLNGRWSVGIIADNAAFPQDKDPSHPKASLTPELFAATVQVGIKTKLAAKSNKSTFHGGGITGDRIESTMSELGSYINRVYAGTNRGRVAIVESDGSSNFVAAKPLGTKLLEEGMVLEAYTAFTSGSVRDSFSGHQITAIDHDTRTVTYISQATGAADDRTLVAGDHIFIKGTYARTPVTMPDIVDNGDNASSIFTLSRTTYPKAKAHVLSNGSVLRNVDEQLLLSLVDAPRRQLGKRITKLLSGGGQYRKVIEHCANDKKYMVPTTSTTDPKYSLGAGKNALSLSFLNISAMLEVDDDIAPRQIFALSTDTFFLYEAMAPGWISDEVLKELVPTTGGHLAGFIGYAGSLENQGCLMPRANARLDDLADPECGDTV